MIWSMMMLRRQWLPAALIAGIVVLSGVIARQAYLLADERRASAELVAAVESERAHAASVAAAASEESRRVEAHWRHVLDIREREHAEKIKRLDTTVRELRATADGLRQHAADAAVGGRDAAADTAEACRVRAAALAELLGETAAEAARMAEAADRAAADVELLCGAWPQHEDYSAAVSMAGQKHTLGYIPASDSDHK